MTAMTLAAALSAAKSNGFIFATDNASTHDITDLLFDADGVSGEYVIDDNRIVALNADGVRESAPTYTLSDSEDGTS